MSQEKRSWPAFKTGPDPKEFANERKHGTETTRSQSLRAQMAITACPLMRPRCERNPKMATARVPIHRPDTYQRLPRTCKISIANSSRFIHSGSEPVFAAFDMNVASRSANVSGARSKAKDQWLGVCGERPVSCGLSQGACRGRIGPLRALSGLAQFPWRGIAAALSHDKWPGSLRRGHDAVCRNMSRDGFVDVVGMRQRGHVTGTCYFN